MRLKLVFCLFALAAFYATPQVLGADAASAVKGYDDMEKGPLKVKMLGGRPFTFMKYADPRPRILQEFEEQNLLTPTWKTPDYYPKMSGIFEWGWTLRPDGGNKRQCYEWTKKWYLKTKKEMQKPDTGWESFTGHEWLSCYGAEFGADMLSIEVAENILATQAQTAMIRGAARLHGIPFSMQASEWYHTVTAFKIGADERVAADPNEAPASKTFAWDPHHYNGGHSSSLMARLWYLSWLSGASFMRAEGCQVNFFAKDISGKTEYVQDKNVSIPKDPNQRAVLSPYGERAKRFKALTDKHSDVGITYTPFLMMLDHFAGFNGYHYVAPRPWQVLQPSLGDWDAARFIDTVFPKSMNLDLVPGVNDEWYNTPTEHTRLVRSPWGDSFDIMLSPRPHGSLGQEKLTKEDPMYPNFKPYQAMINCYPVIFLIGDHEFTFETLKVLSAYLKQGGHILMSKAQSECLAEKFPVLKTAGKLDIYEMKDVPGILDRLAEKHVPFKVTGDVEYIINRTKDGWVIGLFNNEGITKEPKGPVVIDPAKKQNVTLKLKAGKMKSATEWLNDVELPVKDNAVSLAIEPGEICIVECKE